MSKKTKRNNGMSRRRFLPLLGGSFLIPVIGEAQESTPQTTSNKLQDEQYKTLLKPDGTIVKVKASAVDQSKVVKKSLSNSGLLKWLGK